MTVPFRHPFMMNVVRPSQSGTTFWIEKLLCELDRLVSVPIVFVFYLYNGPFQDVFQRIKDDHDLLNKNGDKRKVIFINSTGWFPDVHQVLSVHGIDKLWSCLFVFDNLTFVVCEDKLHGYVMKDCHDYNCSLIFVCQDLMCKAEKLRKILSNSNYVVVFQNIGDECNLYHVFQTRRLSKNSVKAIAQDVFGKYNYGYIVFDNVPSSPSNVWKWTFVCI